jgi:hypothetical protein
VRRRSSFGVVAGFSGKTLNGTLPERERGEPKSRWCSGLAYEPVTLMTRVRIPTGTPGAPGAHPAPPAYFSDGLVELVLPSSCLFRLPTRGPVAQHGRASGFYLGPVNNAGQERNQVVVGSNPARPTNFQPKENPITENRVVSLHFHRKNISEEI